jgi:hypothetical protein
MFRILMSCSLLMITNDLTAMTIDDLTAELLTPFGRRTLSFHFRPSECLRCSNNTLKRRGEL